jgi:hypothetical protein
MKTKPTIINQHEYISINFGNNRRLTCSYSGEKASGAIPYNVFKEFSNRIRAKSDVKIGDRVQQFVDEIDTIWPEWNRQPRKFQVNENVVFDFGKRRGGMDKGVVTKVRGTSVTVRWERNGLIGMTADMLEEQNKVGEAVAA